MVILPLANQQKGPDPAICNLEAGLPSPHATQFRMWTVTGSGPEERASGATNLFWSLCGADAEAPLRNGIFRHRRGPNPLSEWLATMDRQ